jgi:hypothetical protein
VALAGIGTLPDTIGSRSIIINMRRRAPDERIDPYRSRKEAGTAEGLRNRLARWCEHIAPHINLDIELPDEITDRNADCWEPLFAIAEQAGEDWPTRVKQAALSLLKSGAEHTETEGTRLLADIKEAFEGNDKLHQETLLLKLHNLPESPWLDIRGKSLDARGLSSRLKPYGIRSKPIRSGDAVKKGYAITDFDDAWKRYLPSVGHPGYTGYTGYKIDNQNKNVTDVTDVTQVSQETDPFESLKNPNLRLIKGEAA